MLDDRSIDSDKLARYGDHSRTVRRFNFQLLGITLLVVAIVAPAGYFWHRSQVGQIGATLKSRAEALAAEGEWHAASDYIFRYLRVSPDDIEARAELARYYDRSVGNNPARFGRAIDLYYQAIGVAAEKEKAALGHRVLEMLLDTNRFSEAKLEANKLLAGDPNDAKALRSLARALYGQFQLGQRQVTDKDETSAGEVFARAVNANPQDTQLATIWAVTLREHINLLSDHQRSLWPTTADLALEADAVMDRLAAAAANDPQAYLVRYGYRVRYKLPGAEQDLSDAKRVGADRVDVFLTAARHYHQELSSAIARGVAGAEVERIRDTAVADYKHVVDKLDPTNVTARTGLAELYQSQGKMQLAIDTSQKGLKQDETDSPLLQATLTEQLVAAGKLEEADESLKRLDKVSPQTISKLNKNARLAWSRSRDLVEATLRLRQGRARQTILLARPLSVNPLATANEQLRAWLLLGDAYMVLSEWEQAAVSYDSALGLDPKQEMARVTAGEAWLRAGQPAKAAQHFELGLAANSNSPNLVLQLARARLAQQLASAPRSRNWVALTEKLDQLKVPEVRRNLTDPWRVELLQADYALARAAETPGTAVTIDPVISQLMQAERQYADVLALWRELVVRYERLNRREDADRALAACARLSDSTAMNALLASRVYVGRKDFARARQILRDSLASLPTDQHPALRNGLAQLALLEGKPADGQSELEKLLELDPQNLGVLRQLADIALDAGDTAQAQRREDQMRAVEGSDGTSWRYLRARRLLRDVRRAEGAAFDEVVKLQREIQALRPDWPFSYALLGSLAELQGKVAEAIPAYQSAIQLGDVRLVVFERLIMLLFQQSRFAEADDYLTRLSQQVATSEILSPVAISVAAGMKDLDRAQELAKRAIDTRPTDPMAWIWYGQVLLLNKRPAEAEVACRKAVEVAPQDVRAWKGLFTLQMRTSKHADARRTLEQLAIAVTLPDSERAFILAQGNDLLGEVQLAQEQFAKATRLAPDSIAIWAQYAAFLVRRNPREAEQPLRRLLELARKSETTQQIAGNARRTLATLLAARGGEDEFRQALELLQQTDAGVPTSDIDQRLQVALMAQRANPDVNRAQKLLEDLVVTRKSGSDSDRLLLAMVYARQCKSLAGVELRAKVTAAREQFETLCVRPKPNPQHLVLYIEFLLEQSEWTESDRTLSRFESLVPDDLRTLLLRAKWLDRQGRRADIAGVVQTAAKRLESSVQDETNRAGLYSGIGDICTNYQLHAAAESWYRRAVSVDAKWYAQLASSLVKQAKTEEAIRLCLDEVEKSGSAASATVLASILVEGRVSEAKLKPYQSLLDSTLAKHPRDQDVLIAFANLRTLHNHNDEAISLYRAALGVNPQNVVALNNLATLLSESPGKTTEALRYIDEAIQLAGPQSALLDTKGMALVHSQRPAEAVEILRKVSESPQADPRYKFHLAIALQRVGELQQAKSSFDAAINRDLKSQMLTQTDQQLLQELERLLK